MDNALVKSKNKVMQLFSKVKYWLAIAPFFFGNMVSTAFASTTIKEQAPTVGNDGQVNIQGGQSDPAKSVSTLLSQGQFWAGVVAALVGLCITIYGAYRAYHASKAIQDGDQQGWRAVGYITIGTIVGGVILMIVGALLGIGAATGNKLIQ